MFGLGGAQEYPLLNISMRVERKILYWILNVVTPLFILTSCLFTSFSTPRNEFADRCAHTPTQPHGLDREFLIYPSQPERPPNGREAELCRFTSATACAHTAPLLFTGCVGANSSAHVRFS